MWAILMAALSLGATMQSRIVLGEGRALRD